MKRLPPGLVTQPGSSSAYHTGGWRTERPVFRNVACNGCDLCVLYCPDGVVFRIEPKVYGYLQDYCKGCGICAQECPVHDIVMEAESR